MYQVKKNRRYISSIFSVLFILTINSRVHAQQDYELYNKINGDAISGALFGQQSDIYMDRVIVGARCENSNTGAAYIMHYNMSTLEIEYSQRITSPDPASGDYFGHSVAICGDFAVVGAHEDHNSGYSNSGAVYVYRYQFDPINNIWKWMFDHKIESPNPTTNGRFGYSVDIDSTTVVIGATQESYYGKSYSGAAYAFTYQNNDDQWHLRGYLTLYENETASNDFLGYAVAIHKNTAVVTTRDKESQRGAAYVWERADHMFYRRAKLQLNNIDRNVDDYFGQSVDIYDDKIIVGAHNDNHHGTRPGSAFIFQKPSGGWEGTIENYYPLYGSNNASNDRFGYAVSLWDTIAVVGAYFEDNPDDNAGAVYIYGYKESKWELYTKLDSPDPGYKQHFGISVSIYDGYIIIGEDGDDWKNSDEGCAFLYELFAQPENLRITNGINEQYITTPEIILQWDDRSNINESYKIYKNGAEYVTGLGANQTNWKDLNIIPGVVYKYAVAAVDELWGESDAVYGKGWFQPDGLIGGKITPEPPSEKGIPGIKVSAYCEELNSALQLTGSSDYVLVENHPDLNPSNSMTIEAWLKSDEFDRTDWQQFIGKGGDASYTSELRQFGIRPVINTGKPYFYIHDSNNQPHGVEAFVQLKNGEWNHVAASYDSKYLKIYVNGILQGEKEIGSYTINTSKAPLVIGRLLNGTLPQDYNGLIDEVRFWNIVRSETEIKSNMYNILKGNEYGLVAYWKFDEGSGDLACDFALKEKNRAGHHGQIIDAIYSVDKYAPMAYFSETDKYGEYQFTKIFHGIGSHKFYVIPDTSGGRFFDPDTHDVDLAYSSVDETSYKKFDNDFADMSSFPVSGQVKFKDINYYIEDVSISISENPSLEILSDENGEFVVGLQTGTYTIQPSYYNHTFAPEDTTVFINTSTSNLLFKDTTHYILRGKVAAGKDRFDIGEASLIINGPHNCFEEEVSTTLGQYEIRLPALPDISVSLVSIDGEPVSEFLLDHSGDIEANKIVSLVKGDTTLDFIYYAKPQVVIKGFPDRTTVYNVPVLEYMDYENIKFEITEDYGNNRISLSQSGSINIINDITGETELTDIEIDGSEEYSLIFRIGPPNIIPGGSHPYQKRFYARVKTGGGEVDTSIWVIVTGYRPREQTFATVSPAIPLLILRDPPGDHSYSYLEESESISFTTSMSMLKDKSRNDFASLKVGNAFSAGPGFVTFETAVWAMKDSSANIGASALNQTEQQFTITTLERFQTSAEETDIGAESDIFVGAAFNMIYALADILEINAVGEVELSKSIIYGVDNEDAFETTYIYTKKHIEDILLPRFKENLSAETDFDRIQYWKDQIEAWQQIVAFNDNLKLNANEPVGGQSSISISGGAEKYYSTTLEQTVSRTIEFNSYVDTDVAREAGLEIAGSGYKRGVQIRTRLNIGRSERADTTRKQTIGYCIYDDESADNFWIEIKGDPVYGTPVFKLQQGSYTSWPWEKGTIPHEKCLLDIAGDYIQTDVDPNTDAIFTLELTNISPSGRAGTYKLFDIPTSNPDGAELSLYGFSINDVSPFQLEPYQTASVPLRVKRGPFAYDYDDIQLRLRSLYDEQIADTVTFSVHFTAPCSPIRITEPEDNWIVCRNDHDSLKIVLSDYDKAKMTTVMIQYRPKNKTSWEDGSQFAASSLPDNNAAVYWNTKGLAEGMYDLRTRVSWNQAAGYTYSNKVMGVIDRLPPATFGEPQPADGVLRKGGQISITFNEDIDKNTAIADNVTLTNIQNGNKIPTSVSSNERTIIIKPQVDDKVIENQTLQVRLLGVGDINGNILEEAIVWSFSVNNNPVYWTPAIITKTYLKDETATFWAKIKNESDQNITFNIKSIPNWLNVDPANGSISTGGDRIINFSVNSDIEAGYYCDTLFAETPNGDEPLLVILEIQNKPPEWYVNPAAFANSMTITAGFYIGDVPFSGENDLVAAFVGNYLRGVVKVQHVVPRDEYTAFLTVYSDQSTGENVAFRIWDASEGIEFAIAESYAFVADSAYGTAASPESLHVADAMLQSVALAQNWTWFSLGVEAKDMSTKSILEKLRARNGDLIKGHTRYSQYLPGTGWVGTLDTLDIGAGFKIWLTESRRLDFIGTPVPVDDRPIAVDPGWNWIGYLPDKMLSINDALASLAATATDGDLIKNQYTFAAYTNSRWQGILESMIPGEGYMLRSDKGGILTYPGAGGKMIHGPSMISARALVNSAPDWQVNAAAFEYSMNATSALTIDGLPVVNGNTLLAAFINDECRGVSKPVFVKDKWMFFSTIYSDKAEDDSIQFKVYDPGSDLTREVNRKVEYRADKVIGTPAAPLVLWVGIPTGLEDDSELPGEFALEQNYPNPFNPVTTIRYALKQQEDVTLIIYDMLGKKVKVLVNETQEAGWYDVLVYARELASGVYIYRLRAGGFEKARKLVVLK